MILKNQVLERKDNKPIVWDAYFHKNSQKKPLVIFCHGYKGFKDWGAWHLVAQEFSKTYMFFVKFNFSHNGGTIDNPIDFPDLEAFAENNYSKELDDLDAVLNYFTSNNNNYSGEIDQSNIIIIGHSRGGGIAVIKASEDNRIGKLITWAGVCDFAKRTATVGDLEQWKKDGVKYVLNGRTKQQMPHNYQFYEDFEANQDRLNIEKAIKKITIPTLIIHGTSDTSVLYKEAENLHEWHTHSVLFPVKNADHVFNSKHPWEDDKLPQELQEVVSETVSFIKN
ncbi:alpha/beta hydrolase family protein [Hanstruepera ponticola]|uniref:alpha/beta hydrolase family protein n=1 Tax=Hanstruepera ponticola TaxID=2042995 RepID=UPI00177D7E22|nr:alpha/beta hydrolase [Hanstruepera ponticola]